MDDKSRALFDKACQLIPGRDHGHHWLPVHLDPADTKACQHTSLSHADLLPPADDTLTSIYVLSCPDHIFPGADRTVADDPARSIFLCILCHDHRICSLRDHRASLHPHRLSRTGAHVSLFLDPDLPAYMQKNRGRLPGSIGLFCRQGISIHGGPVKWRDILL